MVNEHTCNKLAITELLLHHHSALAAMIEKSCRAKDVDLTLIKGANDYWCRDFMPLQVSRNQFVQFSYNPGYYKPARYSHLKTDISQLSFHPTGTLQASDILLDGGNVCYYDSRAIVTDKIFKDNGAYTKTKLIDTLIELLALEELTIIPSLPYDVTGHADGMVRFIDADSLLLNDFRMISSETYWNKLLKALKRFNLLLLPNDLDKNADADDATGDYINMAVIQDLILVPAYGMPTDDLAQRLIEVAFPGCTVLPILSNELSVKAGVLHCATWNYQV